MHSGPKSTTNDAVPQSRRLRGVVAGCLAAGCLAAAIALHAAPGLAQSNSGDTTADGLHVASPDWRDQIVYFLMIDRFANGERGNDDQGAGEFDPEDDAKFSGGDLRGATTRIPYLRNLGATAVWITPPVANQWWNPQKKFGGYHGYWATDFASVDPHFGTLEDYRAFSRALHRDGMYLIQDVVVNHTANFLAYDATRDPDDPAKGASFVRDTQGRVAPTQAPFDRNDPRDPAQRRDAIYHWTPDIVDFTDDTQRLTWQLAGLDDLDTETPAVRRALRASYGSWIREVGVDAFRVDTALHVPPEYFRDFLHADDAQAPGILRVAEATGRNAFHVFGEGFAIDKPFDDTQARRIDAYMRTPDGQPLLPGMIDFPLYATANDVFARGAPTAQLGWRIANRMRVHADPWRMPTFIDNHDVDRFLAGGDEAGLRQALLMLMTLPGIPVIWQGTEQGFVKQRAPMFERFDDKAPLYRYLQRAIALRRGDRTLSRGMPTVLRDNAAGPGALAWRMTGDDGASTLVAFNTAPHAALLDNIETGLPEGTQLGGVFAIDGDIPETKVRANGRVSIVLPSRAGYVWKAAAAAPDAMELSVRAPTIDALPAERVGGDFVVQGSASAPNPLRLVVDDDLEHAIEVRPDRNGRWQARVDTSAMVDPQAAHTVVVWDAATKNASERRTFHVARAWQATVAVDDPRGDDTGPTGRYTYPADAGWQLRQADIERVDVSTSGGALRIAVRMRALTTPWNPPNGFDHVAFTLFVDLPKLRGGARVMPQQGGELPGDMRWDVRLRASGWSNALFAAQGASATSEGTAISPGALVHADAATRTVTFTLPGGAFGRATDLSGARVYVTTWDYDGGYRALAPVAGPHAFGGGDPARDPRVMDAAGPIVLP
jgi:glycosidase